MQAWNGYDVKHAGERLASITVNQMIKRNLQKFSKIKTHKILKAVLWSKSAFTASTFPLFVMVASPLSWDLGADLL